MDKHSAAKSWPDVDCWLRLSYCRESIQCCEKENKTAQIEANINDLEKEESRIKNSTESQEKERRPDTQMKKIFEKLGELSDSQRNQSEEIKIK